MKSISRRVRRRKSPVPQKKAKAKKVRNRPVSVDSVDSEPEESSRWSFTNWFSGFTYDGWFSSTQAASQMLINIFFAWIVFDMATRRGKYIYCTRQEEDAEKKYLCEHLFFTIIPVDRSRAQVIFKPKDTFQQVGDFLFYVGTAWMNVQFLLFSAIIGAGLYARVGSNSSLKKLTSPSRKPRKPLKNTPSRPEPKTPARVVKKTPQKPAESSDESDDSEDETSGGSSDDSSEDSGSDSSSSSGSE